MDDHLSARRVLRRAVAGGVADVVQPGAAAPAAGHGAPVTAAELEAALAHVAGCDVCAAQFDVAGATAWLEGGEDPQAMDDIPIDPQALFQRALTAALSDPDVIVRERAAARLGGFDRLGAAALSALVTAARDDGQERVRAAALAALDRLDGEVSFPQRVIDAWAATPAEAVRYLGSVLRRLAAGDVLTAGVTRLVGVEEKRSVVVASADASRCALMEAPAAGDQEIELVGDGPVRGRVACEGNLAWLTVEGLPTTLENTKPVVAIPKALSGGMPEIVWAGRGRGLVAATEPVAGGSLRVLLGNVKGPSVDVFDQVYLLHPREGRSGV